MMFVVMFSRLPLVPNGEDTPTVDEDLDPGEYSRIIGSGYHRRPRATGLECHVSFIESGAVIKYYQYEVGLLVVPGSFGKEGGSRAFHAARYAT